jgi:hypothetical protein
VQAAQLTLDLADPDLRPADDRDLPLADVRPRELLDLLVVLELALG